MKPKILVIEDNDINLDLIVFVLNALNVAVFPAISGPDGIAIALSEVPDLIFCDIQMPILDGYRVLAASRSERTLPHIPVLAVTAMAMMGDGEWLLGAGFSGYLSKPIEFDQLKMAIASHVPNWDH